MKRILFVLLVIAGITTFISPLASKKMSSSKKRADHAKISQLLAKFVRTSTRKPELQENQLIFSLEESIVEERGAFFCASKPVGHYGDPAGLSCVTWLYCDGAGNHQWFTCPDGTLFDAIYKVCDFFDQQVCSNLSISADMLTNSRGREISNSLRAGNAATSKQKFEKQKNNGISWKMDPARFYPKLYPRRRLSNVQQEINSMKRSSRDKLMSGEIITRSMTETSMSRKAFSDPQAATISGMGAAITSAGGHTYHTSSWPSSSPGLYDERNPIQAIMGKPMISTGNAFRYASSENPPKTNSEEQDMTGSTDMAVIENVPGPESLQKNAYGTAESDEERRDDSRQRHAAWTGTMTSWPFDDRSPSPPQRYDRGEINNSRGQFSDYVAVPTFMNADEGVSSVGPQGSQRYDWKLETALRELKKCKSSSQKHLRVGTRRPMRNRRPSVIPETLPAGKVMHGSITVSALMPFQEANTSKKGGGTTGEESGVRYHTRLRRSVDIVASEMCKNSLAC